MKVGANVIVSLATLVDARNSTSDKFDQLEWRLEFTVRSWPKGYEANTTATKITHGRPKHKHNTCAVLVFNIFAQV